MWSVRRLFTFSARRCRSLRPLATAWICVAAAFCFSASAAYVHTCTHRMYDLRQILVQKGTNRNHNTGNLHLESKPFIHQLTFSARTRRSLRPLATAWICVAAAFCFSASAAIYAHKHKKQKRKIIMCSKRHSHHLRQTIPEPRTCLSWANVTMVNTSSRTSACSASAAACVNVSHG